MPSKKTPSKKSSGGAKKRGLGRGLEALFEDEEGEYPQVDAEGNIPGASRKILGVEKLFPNKDPPRTYFSPAAINELAESIKKYGLLQPILVRPDKVLEGQYEIVAGERRWRAAQKAQLHEVPVVIRELNDEETLQIALVENLQRRDLNAIEEARGYQRLADDFGHIHDEIGEAVGRSRSHIANIIRLLQLPENVQQMLIEDKISAGHARALLKADKPEALVHEVVKNKLSVRDTEKLVANDQGRKIDARPTSGAPKNKISKDADTIALEKEVSNQIGMGVTIGMVNQSEGNMVINFKSLDQLDDVLRRLSQTPKY